jgi:hypothetical protein
MHPTAIRTGSTVLASLAIIGSGLLTTSAAADQEDGDSCGCPPLSLRSSSDLDDVVAVRKITMAHDLTTRR